MAAKTDRERERERENAADLRHLAKREYNMFYVMVSAVTVIH